MVFDLAFSLNLSIRVFWAHVHSSNCIIYPLKQIHFFLHQKICQAQLHFQKCNTARVNLQMCEWKESFIDAELWVVQC